MGDKVNYIKIKNAKNLFKMCVDSYRGIPKIDKPEYMSHIFCKAILNVEKRLYVSFDISPSTGDVIQFYSNLRFGPLSSYQLWDETTGETLDMVDFCKAAAKDIFYAYEKRVFKPRWSQAV